MKIKYLFFFLTLFWGGLEASASICAQLVAASEFYEAEISGDLKLVSANGFKAIPWDLPIEQFSSSASTAKSLVTVPNGSYFVAVNSALKQVKWGDQPISPLSLQQAIFAEGDGNEWMAPLVNNGWYWIYGIGDKVIFGSPCVQNSVFINGSTAVMASSQNDLHVVARDGTLLKTYSDTPEAPFAVNTPRLKAGADLVAFTPDGKTKVNIYETTQDPADPLRLLNTYDASKSIENLEVSPTGKRVFIQEGNSFFSYKRAVNQWQPLPTPSGFEFKSMRLSFDGEYLLRLGRSGEEMVAVVTHVESGRNTLEQKFTNPYSKDNLQSWELLPNASGGWTVLSTYSQEEAPWKSTVGIFSAHARSFKHRGSLSNFPRIRNISASPQGVWLRIDLGVRYSYEVNGETKLSEILYVVMDDSDDDQREPHQTPVTFSGLPQGTFDLAK